MPVLVQTLLEYAAAQIIGLPQLHLFDGAQSSTSEIRAFIAAFENHAVLKTRIVMELCSTECYGNQGRRIVNCPGALKVWKGSPPLYPCFTFASGADILAAMLKSVWLKPLTADLETGKGQK